MNWRFRTEADPGLNGREMYWPRGKVLGGSSSINGLVWMRGLPGDFDDWAAAGNPGWAWDDVATVFDEIEEVGDGTARPSGRVSVADRSADYHPISRHYLAAADAAGVGLVDQACSHWAEGAGPYRITTRRGLRDSAAQVFLKPARHRQNLAVRTDVLVDRCIANGKNLGTVRYRQHGAWHQVSARAEVLLCAGAIGSPAILQRSGVGPGQLLTERGVEPIHTNASVGGGLQDHLGVDYMFRANTPTLNQVLGSVSGRMSAALAFATRRGGPLTLSVNQMGGLVRSRAGLSQADLQLYFTPLSYSTKWRNKRPLLRPDNWPGFAFGFNICRPTSRGNVDVASPNPEDAPRIRSAYLSTSHDAESTIAGGRLIERMLATDAMRDLIVSNQSFSPEGASYAQKLVTGFVRRRFELA